MAMTVAETPVLHKADPSAQTSLGVLSLLGGLLALLGIWFVLGGLPVIWSDLLQVGLYVNDFLSTALLLLVTCVVALGLAYWGVATLRRLPIPGLRTGIFFGAVFLFLVLWLSIRFGNWMTGREAGMILTVGLFGLLLGGVIWMFTRAGFANWLRGVDEQGWFHSGSYKANQGVRVRRCTVVAVLVLGISGILTLVNNRSLGSERYGANDWIWRVPFSSVELEEQKKGPTGELETVQYDQYLAIPLMHKVHVVVPVLLLLALLWFSYRLVNWPVFADFLIATEAEMNKVSWTSRRRLFQDTIVVLVTVILLTSFLFAVDVLWIKVLSWPPVGVLRVDVREEIQKQQEKTQW